MLSTKMKKRSPEFKKAIGISDHEQDGWKFDKSHASVLAMFRTFKRKAKQMEKKWIEKEEGIILK